MESLQLGLAIKIERLSRGIKQRSLAARISLSPSKLSSIECGWTTPSEELLAAICYGIGTTPETVRKRAERLDRSGKG